jgi:hypothetical protein
MSVAKALLFTSTAIGLTASSAGTGAPAPRMENGIELAYLDSPWRRCLRNHSRLKCAIRAARGELGSSRNVPVPPTPPSPPMPPPVVCDMPPAFVFFDYGKDEVIVSAQHILDKVAAAYTACPGGLSLAGHTDRSESDVMGLSQRRAQNVSRYLEARGVPRDALTTEAYGESRPLVPTADGVREPQNRRVEIVMGPGSGW